VAPPVGGCSVRCDPAALELVDDAQHGRVRSVVATPERVLWRTGEPRPYEADLPVLLNGRTYGQRELAGLLQRDVEVRGSLLPTGVRAAAVVASFAAFLLLVAGPDPQRANRWAWFWLLSLGREAGVGVVLFLLLSGPLPGLRPADPERRRWDGWRGFVVSIVTGLALSLLWLGLPQLVWPSSDGVAEVGPA
jgi:multisubunit Na+/H+ antiporter MnhB subunit